MAKKLVIMTTIRLHVIIFYLFIYFQWQIKYILFLALYLKKKSLQEVWFAIGIHSKKINAHQNSTLTLQLYIVYFTSLLNSWLKDDKSISNLNKTLYLCPNFYN